MESTELHGWTLCPTWKAENAAVLFQLLQNTAYLSSAFFRIHLFYTDQPTNNHLLNSSTWRRRHQELTPYKLVRIVNFSTTADSTVAALYFILL